MESALIIVIRVMQFVVILIRSKVHLPHSSRPMKTLSARYVWQGCDTMYAFIKKLNLSFIKCLLLANEKFIC